MDVTNCDSNFLLIYLSKEYNIVIRITENRKIILTPLPILYFLNMLTTSTNASFLSKL